MSETLLILGWMACGVYGFGITYAYEQRHWPSQAEEFRREDYGMAMFIVCWVVGGVAAFGVVFADFQGRYPKWFADRRRRHHYVYASVMALGGPLGLAAALLFSGAKHGWRIR